MTTVPGVGSASGTGTGTGTGTGPVGAMTPRAVRAVRSRRATTSGDFAGAGPAQVPDLSTAAELLTRAVDHGSDLLFVLTADVRVVALNRAAAAWLAMPPESVVGRLLADLGEHSRVAAANRSLFLGMPVILGEVDGRGEGFAEDEMTVFDATGRLVTASTRLDPMPGAAAAPLVAWSIRLLDERRAIFRASTVAMARLDAQGRFIQANAALQRLLGMAEEDLVGTSFVDLVHPQDREMCPVADEGVVGDSEHRLLHRDGRTVWTRVTRSLLPGSHRVEAVTLVVAQDVTGRREAEAVAARNAAEDELLARVAELALAAPDETTLLDRVGALLRTHTGAGAVEWDRRGRGGPDRGGAGWVAAQLPPNRGGRIHVRFPVGEERPLLVTAVADLMSTGLARLHAESALREQSLRDPLTGLANRRLLLARLEDALHLGQVERGVCVLFVDLDGFKAVNDAHGHEVGDEVLAQFANRLRALVRGPDVVCRWGGDEFVVMCRGLALAADGESLGRRIEEAARLPFECSVGEVRLGASVGAGMSAGAGHDPTTIDELLRQADEAMYRVKRQRVPQPPPGSHGLPHSSHKH